MHQLPDSLYTRYIKRTKLPEDLISTESHVGKSYVHFPGVTHSYCNYFKTASGKFSKAALEKYQFFWSENLDLCTVNVTKTEIFLSVWVHPQFMLDK
jgi:hypothetical protein